MTIQHRPEATGDGEGSLSEKQKRSSKWLGVFAKFVDAIGQVITPS
jgi:hypothetical protein